MKMPAITAFYLGILILIYAVLALRVAGLRRRNRTIFGDADNMTLRNAIRVHANFIEYAPLALLMLWYDMAPATRDFGYAPKVTIAEGLQRLSLSLRA